MATATTTTLYDVLGTNQHATSDEVKMAYKRMALRCHPDKNPGNEKAVATFQEIGRAFETLYDSDKRRAYDATIRSFTANDPNDWEHVWGGSWSSTAYPAKPPKGPNHGDFRWNKGTRASSTREQRYQQQADQEEWNAPYTEPAQDWYEKWMEEEKKFQEEVARKAAARRAKRDKTDLHVYLAALPPLLETIKGLNEDVQQAKAACKAARSSFHKVASYGLEDDVNDILKCNMMLNQLRRRREANLEEYRVLCKKLKKLDVAKAQEAKEKLRCLQTRRPPSQEGLSKTSDRSGSRNVPNDPRPDGQTVPNWKPLNPASAPFVPRSQSLGESPPDPYLWNVATEADAEDPEPEEPYVYYDNQGAFDNSTRATTDPFESADDYIHHFNDGNEIHNSQDVHEKMVNATRLAKHRLHRDVRGDFWSIAGGVQQCAMCMKERVVLQCPEYEVCGILACAWCKA